LNFHTGRSSAYCRSWRETKSNVQKEISVVQEL
jgi:hypothetical protein